MEERKHKSADYMAGYKKALEDIMHLISADGLTAEEIAEQIAPMTK